MALSGVRMWGLGIHLDCPFAKIHAFSIIGKVAPFNQQVADEAEALVPKKFGLGLAPMRSHHRFG
jgi:hypothetical protein